MRNSITWAIRGNSGKGGGRDAPQSNPEEATVYIGTNVEYAGIQEYYDMRHKVGKAHFLRDAATTHTEEYKKTIEAALKT